jgi:hypothetical protein
MVKENAVTMGPASPTRHRSPVRVARARRRRAVLMGTAVLLLGLPAAASGQSAPPPPGPPPGNGADLPAAPGTALAFVPPGTPAAIPGGAPGPGLASGRAVRFNRRSRAFSLPLACQGNGTIRVRARVPDARTVASAGYRCARNRATAALRVSPAIARRLARSATVAATATVRQGGRTARLHFTLATRGSAPATPGFWTDGHLQCTPAGTAVPQAYLVQPDFTTTTPTPVSTRGWIAWHTAAGGWHWLGARGPDAGRWDTWTATPTGIAQFHPGGTPTPVPWTWGPISVPGGQGIHAVGVYEIVYWVGGRPEYRWQYVNAGTTGAAAAGGGAPACAYP